MKILVTGGAGFIGSTLIRTLIGSGRHAVVNLDKLTYASNPAALATVEQSPRYTFAQLDICDRSGVAHLLAAEQPDAIVHLAAETHVDRSIDGPSAFVQTNLVGTSVLLEAALVYWQSRDRHWRDCFRFHHVSTDEVYGSLGSEGLFREDTPYAPNSPYSASKAGSDHLVRAWHHTYGLPTLVTNCSNNYGPWQFPEKLIPLVILRGLSGKAMPIYGSGENIRDWLHVEDHAQALITVLEKGRPGDTYNVGGNAERRNIDVVRTICTILDRLAPDGAPHERLIEFVTDRPGHDLRYAIDARKVAGELLWSPQRNFENGLENTVQWYLDNRAWWEPILTNSYRTQRLGLGRPV